MDVTEVGILSLPIYSQIILKEVCTSVTPLLLLGISISFSVNKGKFLITKLALTHSQAFKPPCSFIPHISHSSTSGMVGILLYSASKNPNNSMCEWRYEPHK